MNNRRINASYTNTENHNLHEGLLLSAVSVISKGDKVLIITKNTHTVSQVEQWVQKWAVLSFSLYMWHLQGPDIPLKVASICSSVLPLVSGTKTMVKMTFRMHMEANSQKVPALVRRFCKANRYPGGGGERGRKRERESKREREREREGGGGGHRELCQKHSKYPDCSANSIQIFIPASKYVFTALQIVTHMNLTVIFPSCVCWRGFSR